MACDELPLPRGRITCMNICQLFVCLTPGLLLSLVFGNTQAHAQAAPKADPLHAWVGATTPAALTAWIGDGLAAEQKDLAALMAVKVPHSVESTVRPFHGAQNELAVDGDQAYLV